MYYNQITKERTIYPYRFKTEQEFEADYGENWTGNLEHSSWNYNRMRYLLGTTLEFNMDSIKYLFGDGSRRLSVYDLTHEEWLVSDSMIKPNLNIDFDNLYKTKKLVYENKLLKFNNFNK